MALICPECRGVLQLTGRGTARCTLHPGEYTVLFLRDEPMPVTGGAADPSGPEPVLATPPELAVATQPASGRPPTGMRCVQHPAQPATQVCQSCGACMCDTCDFALPGGLHFCPACATKPGSVLGPKRKRALVWSFVCAAVSSVAFVLAMGFAGLHPPKTPMEQQAIGTVMMVVVLVPAIAGFGVGLGAVDRRRQNPMSLWAATCWNGLVIGIFLLLAAIGVAQ